MIEFVSLAAIQFLFFYIPATIYLSIDLLFPTFSNRYKIQSERRQPTWEQIRHCITDVGFSDLGGIVVQVALRSAFGWNKAVFVVSSDLPSIQTIIFDFFFGLIAKEITFYYAHRAFHHPKLYAKIHKKHHKFTAPMAFTASYAHPVEHVIANILPVLLPLALKRTHLLSYCIYGAFEFWEAAAVHSGYDFVRMPAADMHDLHHEKFRVNYGAYGFMDWIHGTNVVGWDRPKQA